MLQAVQKRGRALREGPRGGRTKPDNNNDDNDDDNSDDDNKYNNSDNDNDDNNDNDNNDNIDDDADDDDDDTNRGKAVPLPPQNVPLPYHCRTKQNVKLALSSKRYEHIFGLSIRSHHYH